MPWLTGDEIPEDEFCRVIRVPNDPTFIHAVSGALLDLTYAYNWEQLGALTPEEQADAFDSVYVAFMNSEGCDDITPIYPYTFYAPAALAVAGNQGTITKTFLAAAWGGMLAEPLPIAINNDMVFLCHCAPGAWTIRVVGQTGASYGIMTAEIDGVSLGTFDWYSAGAVNNVVATFTITLTDPYPVRQLHLQINSKRAAATNYKMMISGVYGIQNSETP